MSKRPPSGFVPIPFKSAAKVLLPVSLIMIILGSFHYLIDWKEVTPAILFVGLGLLVISLYLLFIVPKNRE